MFDTDSSSWILASQIFAVATFLLGAYVLFFWTPVGCVVGFLWYDYLKRRFGRKPLRPNDERSNEHACWLRYQHWVNVSLAWRLGLDLCRRRSERSLFRSPHAMIYEILSSGTPPSQVTSCANGFADWEQDNLNRLARYMVRELSGGQADCDAVVAFLHEERRLVGSEPMRFLSHADRLAERFGIRPFVVQKWAAGKPQEGTP